VTVSVVLGAPALAQQEMPVAVVDCFVGGPC